MGEYGVRGGLVVGFVDSYGGLIVCISG